MTDKFMAGDRVTCVVNYKYLTEGGEYIIQSTGTATVTVKNDCGLDGTYWAAWFERASAGELFVDEALAESVRLVSTVADTPIRTRILGRANELVNGDRQEEYGTPQENLGRIAKMWSVLLERETTPHEVALCMAALKAARLVNTPEHEDSWVDAAAYMALGGELSSGE